MSDPKVPKANRAYAEGLPPGRHQVILASVHLERCAFYFRRGVLWGIVLTSIIGGLAILAARMVHR